MFSAALQSPLASRVFLRLLLHMSSLLQTGLVHLNLDARHVTDACLCLLLPLGGQLKELDMYGAKVTSKGAHVLAGAYTGLEKLDLCGGHITG